MPHQLIDQTVNVRVEGDEVVICHQGRDGVTEVARHRAAPLGSSADALPAGATTG